MTDTTVDGTAPTEPDSKQATMALVMSTFAFTVCFACWVINGVLIAYLVNNKIFAFSTSQTSWLLALPILTGAISRVPRLAFSAWAMPARRQQHSLRQPFLFGLPMTAATPNNGGDFRRCTPACWWSPRLLSLC